jgi:hypothetical protein
MILKVQNLAAFINKLLSAPQSTRHHANDIALGGCVGRALGRWSAGGARVPRPSGALGQLGDLCGRAVQDRSIEFPRALTTYRAPGPIWLAVPGCATSPFEPLGRLSWDNLPLKRRGAFRLRCARDFNVGLLCKNLIRHPFCLQPSTNKETGPLDVSGKLQRCLQYR